MLSHDFLAVAKTCRCCKFMLTNNQVWQALAGRCQVTKRHAPSAGVALGLAVEAHGTTMRPRWARGLITIRFNRLPFVDAGSVLESSSANCQPKRDKTNTQELVGSSALGTPSRIGRWYGVCPTTGGGLPVRPAEPSALLVPGCVSRDKGLEGGSRWVGAFGSAGGSWPHTHRAPPPRPTQRCARNPSYNSALGGWFCFA
jgi:hypothetical protein